MLNREDILKLASQAIAQTDGNPRGACTTWSTKVYDWLTDKAERFDNNDVLHLQNIDTLIPGKDIAEFSSGALPKDCGGHYMSCEHTYLMIGDRILDPSIGQFFKDYESVSERVLGRREKMFFGTRDELRTLVKAAIEHDEIIYKYPEKCFIRCWGNTSMLHLAFHIKLDKREVKQNFGTDADVMTKAFSHAADRAMQSRSYK